MIRLFNGNDPALEGHFWHFVYLHGLAEMVSEYVNSVSHWGWCAPDLCKSDAPLPSSPGEYDVELYGQPAKAVLSKRWYGAAMGGRVALVCDAVGLAHARCTEDWR